MSLYQDCTLAEEEGVMWDFIEYEEKCNKTTCHALLVNGKICDFKLAGKNTSNLKVNV